MAELRRGDLFSVLEQFGCEDFANELLRVGLVSATQLYEIAALSPEAALVVPLASQATTGQGDPFLMEKSFSSFPRPSRATSRGPGAAMSHRSFLRKRKRCWRSQT